MYSMLDSGNIDLALETVDQRIAAAERSGNKRAGQEAKMIRNLIQTDPVKAKNLAQMMGSVTGGADWWAMTGGKGPFEGTGMEAQSRNILLTGDPNSPEYAAAYQYVSQPKVDMKTGTTITPDMSAFTPPGGVPGSGGAPGGGPTVSMTRTPQQIEADKASAGLSLRQIADLRSNPAVAKNLGWAGLIPNEPGGAAADAKAQMLQMQGKAFLQAFEMLKGGGQITEREGAAAAAAMSRMQAIVENGGSYEAYIKALDEFEEQVRIGARKLGVTFDGSPPPQGSAQQQAPSRRSYLDALD
jgi:hypothetical protein